MSARHLLLLVLLFAVLVGVMFLRRAAEPRPAVDLVARFDQAEKRSSSSEHPIARKDESIGGDARRAISVYPVTRITWKLTLPIGARLRSRIGVDAAAWNVEGNGAQFRVGVSSPSGYEQLSVQQVDPHENAGDRRWIPLSVDLSRYGGQFVSLILSTECGPGRTTDCRNDFAYWGSPAITLR